MNDKIKLLVIAVAGMVGSFVIFLGLFWLLLPSGPPEPATAQSGSGGASEASELSRVQLSRDSVVPGGEVLAYAGVLGENVPLEPEVNGYRWAGWGMAQEEVIARLKAEGVQDIQSYGPPGRNFSTVVAVNPDNMRYKVEYRFSNNELFHVEIFYSGHYRNTSFNAFLLDRMREYGRPYEQYAKVDEMGNVILHAKWDTEITLIELVSYPNGRYQLYLDRQLTIIQLENQRKSQERLQF